MTQRNPRRSTKTCPKAIPIALMRTFGSPGSAADNAAVHASSSNSGVRLSNAGDGAQASRIGEALGNPRNLGWLDFLEHRHLARPTYRASAASARAKRGTRPLQAKVSRP